MLMQTHDGWRSAQTKMSPSTGAARSAATRPTDARPLANGTAGRAAGPVVRLHTLQAAGAATETGCGGPHDSREGVRRCCMPALVARAHSRSSLCPFRTAAAGTVFEKLAVGGQNQSGNNAPPHGSSSDAIRKRGHRRHRKRPEAEGRGVETCVHEHRQGQTASALVYPHHKHAECPQLPG